MKYYHYLLDSYFTESITPNFFISKVRLQVFLVNIIFMRFYSLLYSIRAPLFAEPNLFSAITFFLHTYFFLFFQGSNFTSNLTLANPDLINGTGVGVLQYLQRVTNKIDLGTGKNIFFRSVFITF